MPDKKKKRRGKSRGKSTVREKYEDKPDVGKIYATKDGFFNDRNDIKKPRHVAVIDQRKDDGALAVVKIYSKENKKGDAYLKRPVLKPKKHPALDKPSIVGKKVHIGVKVKKRR